MRSMLYVPADQPSMLAKCRQRGADVVVIDLEDAIAAANKHTARSAAADFLADPPMGSSAIMVRVNNTSDLHTDLSAVLSPNLVGIVLAKASDLDTLDQIDRVLSAYESAEGMQVGAVTVVCLIESAIGVRAAFELASHARTSRLALGEADLGADLGIAHDADDAVWGPIRARVVVDSAAAGIDPPVGPVPTEFRALTALKESTVALAMRGFAGRAAIHPDQIPIINAIFMPDEAAVAQANDVIARYEQALDGGVAVVVDADGRMVDEAVIRHARRIVALYTRDV